MYINFMKEDLSKILLVVVMIGVSLFFNHQYARSFNELRVETETEVASVKDIGILEEALQVVQVVDDEEKEVNSESVDRLLLGEFAQPKSDEKEGFDSLVLPEEESFIIGGDKLQQFNASLPEVNAAAAAVADLETGMPYFEMNGGRRWPMASITKLMTATVAFGQMDLEAEKIITDKDLEPLNGYIDLNVGDRYTINDLIKIMLTASNNGAAEAIASAYGRNEFINKMNEQAEEWDMRDTYFKDPTGISVSNQSTIRDLSKMVRKIYGDFPEVFEATRVSRVAVRDLSADKLVRINSNNEFAGQSSFLGGKTGYTDEARGNLISLFSYRGQDILIVVLGTENRFGETEDLFSWFKKSF